MKISRPPQAQSPASLPKTPGINAAKGKGFAAHLHRAERASAPAAGGPQKATAARKAAAVADIGAELQAGKLTPQGAIDKVIERVLDRQLGKTAAPALRAQLAAALRETLADDPLLSAKVRAMHQE
ncbi:MAG: hypothetical protein JXP73_05615 [Deltaproteobacteria bacterium]|nr:hypothetical protein [Deltaproteobacteria bacterium]